MKNTPYLVVFQTERDTVADELTLFLCTMPSHKLNNTVFRVRTTRPLLELAEAIQSRTRDKLSVSVFAVADSYVLQGLTHSEHVAGLVAK